MPAAKTGGAPGDAPPESPGTRRPFNIYDLHCHLDFAGNASALACRAADRGAAALSCTVTPAGYEKARAVLGGCGNVRVGLGAHPWWVADGRVGEKDLARFEDLAARTRWIGEVGLDFAPRRDGTQGAQRAALERILHACRPGSVLSVHAVRSAGAVLDLLEACGTLRGGSTCILHWFSGTSAELARAVRLGCRFSLGTRMLATKRGRAYARAVPADRLLLETDLPDDACSEADACAWLVDLARAVGQLAQARGASPEELGEILAANSRALLDL